MRVAQLGTKGRFSFAEGRELAKLEWRLGEDPEPPGPGEPKELRGPFEVERVWPWPWRDAPTLVLTPELRTRLHSRVADIHDAFMRRAHADIAPFMEPYFKVMEEMYPGKRSARLRPNLQRLFEHEDIPWKVAPLTPAVDDYRLVRKGQMVECVNAQGQALIRLLDPKTGSDPDAKPLLGWRMYLWWTGKTFEIMR